MPTPLTQWILAGLSLTVAVLLLFVFLQRGTIKTQRDNIASLKVSVQSFEESQKTNLNTIARQKAALEKWVEMCGADEAAIDASVRALEADKARLEQELARARDDREVIYVKDPAAREWSDTGMPSGIADRLFPHPHRPH